MERIVLSHVTENWYLPRSCPRQCLFCLLFDRLKRLFQFFLFPSFLIFPYNIPCTRLGLQGMAGPILFFLSLLLLSCPFNGPLQQQRPLSVQRRKERKTQAPHTILGLLLSKYNVRMAHILKANNRVSDALLPTDLTQNRVRACVSRSLASSSLAAAWSMRRIRKR